MMKKAVEGVFKKRNLKKFKEPSRSEKVNPKLPVIVKFAKPILEVKFSTIKFLAGTSFILLFSSILLSFKLFLTSIRIRKHLGYFINMVSKDEGNILPSLQAIPVFLFLCINVIFTYTLFKLFEKMKKRKLNFIIFLLIMISVTLIFFNLILLIIVLSHSYAEHKELHNGITAAMLNYSTNSLYKEQIDRLQIEFQCCGSKKYDEWYNITWYDSNLIKKGTIDYSQGNTPFSCCSISSIFPCIHHDIEITGRVYLYTPEQNLSISTEGCYLKLRKKKKEVGWTIVGNLFLFILLQVGIIICIRLLQTAHFVNSKFEGHSKLYTVWLFGYYVGKRKGSISTKSTESE